MLSLSFVTGTEPDKWFNRFAERTRHGGISSVASDDATALLITGDAELGLVRLPDQRIDSSFHVVELYEEQPGIALPKEHELSLLDALTPEDITEEIVHCRMSATTGVDVAQLRTHLQVVAANVGVAIAPRPLIKTLSAKQIEHRPFHSATIQPTRIALVWKKDNDSEAIQDFVGIAKGRTPNSSRQAQPKKTAREKSLAKQRRRQANSAQSAPTTTRGAEKKTSKTTKNTAGKAIAKTKPHRGGKHTPKRGGKRGGR
ncbi:MAG: LysR family transcriptional regulator substrate-binding protein [Corynebacterium sp.]|uniref:LysR family transcriptional regulator substrate-binding protein n=1 Tax=Corynebacterium sp. TaxID=1720 RepID=UPI0026DCD0A5|nr:LysR family transcriptional regulator substrate-binding protein [Corynebacterium sp.]MDO4761350.1 LysR family transcriptional regulator substrate-binding protein [Corynebacterium sp.]